MSATVARTIRSTRDDLALFAPLPLFDMPGRSRREVIMEAVGREHHTLDETVALVLELWRADVQAGDMSAQTYDRYRQITESFLRYALAKGAGSLDGAAGLFEEWLSARGRDRLGRLTFPGLAVRHLRACAVRALYRSARFLGLTATRLPYSPGIRRRTRLGRPLNLAEATALRRVLGTDGFSRVPAAIALGLSGAGSVDIGNIRIRDIHADDGTIHLPGGGRTHPRVVAIAGEWERSALIRRVESQLEHGALPTDGLIVNRSGSDSSRQAGAAIAVSAGTERAGLRGDGDVKPASLQRLAAMVAFDTTGDISEAALLLGTTSLDTAAQAITWDWSSAPHTVTEPFPDYQPRVIR